MSKDFQFCEKCFEVLGRKDVKLLKLWMELCNLGMQFNDLMIINGISEEDRLKLLESLGFIVTHENDKHILLKVVGRSSDKEGTFYCPCNCYKEMLS